MNSFLKSFFSQLQKLFLSLKSCKAFFRVNQTASLFFHSGESAEHARAERVVRVREARRDLRQGQGQHDHLPPRRQEGEGPLNGLMCRYSPDVGLDIDIAGNAVPQTICRDQKCAFSWPGLPDRRNHLAVFVITRYSEEKDGPKVAWDRASTNLGGLSLPSTIHTTMMPYIVHTAQAHVQVVLTVL